MLSIPNRKGWGAEILRECLHVTCHVLHFFFSFLDNELELVGGGSVIDGAYPVLFLCSNQYALN